MTKLHLNSIKWSARFLYEQIKRGTITRIGLYNWYVKKNLKKRTGRCIDCGHCCWNLETMERCQHYNEGAKEFKCKINGEKPQHCKDFPITKGETKLCNCQGYKFK